MAKILVIDDDQAIVDLLRLRLTEAGHQVFAAMDATGGVMVAAREKPDLITLDYQMPAGDGVKTLQRLRGNTFTAGTPIIFVTGMSPYDLESAIPNAPKVRFLQKPIDMERLNRLIAELLAPAAPAAPPPAAPTAPKTESTDGGAFGGDILKPGA
jgi:DNA-binding response OmpR family regulator